MRILQTFFIGMCTSVLLLMSNASSDTRINLEQETQLIETKTSIDIGPKEISEPETDIKEYHSQQIQCMAENTYFEARGEPLLGKIAVNNVVMNRLNDPEKRFGNSPCEVIQQITYNKKKKKVCQFSWRCEKNRKIRNYEQFLEIKTLVEEIYNGSYGDVTNGAKYYHATYVNPKWNLTRITKIGQHIFYR